MFCTAMEQSKDSLQILTVMKIQNLYTQREHLREAAENDRQILANLWEKGRQNTWLFKKIEQRRNLTESKIDRINNKICPFN